MIFLATQPKPRYRPEHFFTEIKNATGLLLSGAVQKWLRAPSFNPPADGIALDGLRRGWAYIERATNNGAYAEARFLLMSASMQGGVNPRLHHGTLNHGKNIKYLKTSQTFHPCA
jgi:alcohol dehydrogenase class IV